MFVDYTHSDVPNAIIGNSGKKKKKKKTDDYVLLQWGKGKGKAIISKSRTCFVGREKWRVR